MECDADRAKIKLLFRSRREQSKAHRKGQGDGVPLVRRSAATKSNDGMRRESGEKVSWQDPIVRFLVLRSVAGMRK